MTTLKTVKTSQKRRLICSIARSLFRELRVDLKNVTIDQFNAIIDDYIRLEGRQNTVAVDYWCNSEMSRKEEKALWITWKTELKNK